MLKFTLPLTVFGDTVIEENEVSSQEKVKDVIFLHHRLNEIVKVEYLRMKDPLELWRNLKGR